MEKENPWHQMAWAASVRDLTDGPLDRIVLNVLYNITLPPTSILTTRHGHQLRWLLWDQIPPCSHRLLPLLHLLLHKGCYTSHLRLHRHHPFLRSYVLSSSNTRVLTFILRAVLASVQSDADNIHVFLAYEIIYNTGFFGLLYSAYSLVTARYVLHPQHLFLLAPSPVSRLQRTLQMTLLPASFAITFVLHRLDGCRSARHHRRRSEPNRIHHKHE